MITQFTYIIRARKEDFSNHEGLVYKMLMHELTSLGRCKNTQPSKDQWCLFTTIYNALQYLHLLLSVANMTDGNNLHKFNVIPFPRKNLLRILWIIKQHP